MNHSKMLTKRRKKAKAKKDTARIVKQEKRVKKDSAKAAGAGAATKTPS